MRIRLIALFATMLLAGCERIEANDGGRHAQGRYTGVGLYDPSALWSRQKLADREEQSRALLADDSKIIVVTDSVTGEVRQCGNMSERCIAMDPWRDRNSPVELTAHASDLVDGEDGTRPFTKEENEADALNARATNRTSATPR